MKLKIPPPVLVILFGLMIWWPSTIAWVPGFEFPGQAYLALLVLAGGLALDLLSLLAFRRNNTTINPLKPESAQQLVTTGLNRFSRNPMYLGLLLMLTAVAIYSGSLLGFVGLPIFVIAINYLQIGPEEEALEARFGDTYLTYKANVRRWL
jgi:protein-S-isoprenylcysteine O-methyltransferase Ste14